MRKTIEILNCFYHSFETRFATLYSLPFVVCCIPGLASILEETSHASKTKDCVPFRKEISV